MKNFNIDEAFLEIDDKVTDYGLKSLTDNERTLYDVYIGWGLLLNEGLHGLLFTDDSMAFLDNLIVRLKKIEMTDIASCFSEAKNLYLEYLNNGDSVKDADDFRLLFQNKLNSLESLLYPQEDKLYNKLSNQD